MADFMRHNPLELAPVGGQRGIENDPPLAQKRGGVNGHAGSRAREQAASPRRQCR
jgi:hypothetical protein